MRRLDHEATRPIRMNRHEATQLLILVRHLFAEFDLETLHIYVSHFERRLTMHVIKTDLLLELDLKIGL